MSETTTYTVAFPFGGIGGGAVGFLQAESRLFGRAARFRSLGSIDFDEMSCRDFRSLTGSPALCADVAKLTAADMRAFFGDVAPDVVFSSPPCKSYSSLLSAKLAKTAKYRTMANLLLVWTRLMLEAWPEPPKLVLVENVPRIATRGKRLLSAVKALLRRAGYLFHAASHDAGELGGLAQHRKRFLLVARHAARCPPLLYQPPKKRVRGCGEVLGLLPLPGEGGGPMHELPKLSWLNWVRLALIPAGGDWRDLPGVLLDGQPRREVFRRHHVQPWTAPSATVAGSGSNGPSAVADPRVAPDEGAGFGHGSDDVGETAEDSAPPSESGPKRGWNRGALGVLPFDAASGTVTGNGRPSAGRFSVADPRVVDRDLKPPNLVPQAGNASLHEGKYRVRGWEQPAGAVIGATRVGSGAPSVADPRAPFAHADRVTAWDAPVGTVTHSPAPSSGAAATADPRPRERAWFNHIFKVVPWDTPSGTVTGASKPSSGAVSIADPRVKVAYDHGYGVLRFDEPSSTVAGGSHVGQGAYAVADARLGCAPRAGSYGVIAWQDAAKTVTGVAGVDNGSWAVADTRTEEVVMVIRDTRKPPPRVPVIVAADGTWHRPLTTLELAALQGLPTTMPDGSPLVLASRDGKPSHSAWRERIGNAVPAPAARAIAEKMLVALQQADAEAFSLSCDPYWVGDEGRIGGHA